MSSHLNTRTFSTLRLTLGALILIIVAPGASGDDASLDAVFRNPAVRAALESIRADEPAIVANQIQLCEIPSPTFGESARAQAVKAAFEQLGLSNVRLDKAGNVLGDRPGVSARPRLVVAAHLDTVFPEGTDVRVRRTGTVLTGPGVGDNCRGLAVLLAVARTLGRAKLQTEGSVTFVADVGEEGLGDLRGMKQLFGETMKGQIDRFLSIDGAGLFLINTAVGSRRYRITFKGPGGHSYAAFGTASPVQAMGRAIAKISQLQVPSKGTQPRTTFNVGRVGGGTSINAIPAESWMEIDLRSADAAALAALDASLQRVVDQAVREENLKWRGQGTVTVAKELVGDRPSGQTSADSPVVQTALAAARALDIRLSPIEGSTDANIPIQLKIPAITIGAGGQGTRPHTVGETFDTSGAWRGAQYAALVVIALSR
jgi:acetylornithine deacetylase/succinyl-diaminopimelate desuccinylase-like protein